jgi:hypothetical protein
MILAGRQIFVLAPLLLAPVRLNGQCPEQHYRWSEKIDGSLASVTPARTYVTTILKSWAPLELTRAAKYKCWDRAGRELKVYSLTGWLRRVRTGESDGDWHIELTSRQDSPVDSCIVLEIPPSDLNGIYAQARLDLRSRVSWDAHGDVDPPVRLRFIGAAFFDGQHRGADLAKTHGSHGRCNSSARGLWELHPVYWVLGP